MAGKVYMLTLVRVGVMYSGKCQFHVSGVTVNVYPLGCLGSRFPSWSGVFFGLLGYTFRVALNLHQNYLTTSKSKLVINMQHYIPC